MTEEEYKKGTSLIYEINNIENKKHFLNEFSYSVVFGVATQNGYVNERSGEFNDFLKEEKDNIIKDISDILTKEIERLNQELEAL